jgi:hypothetical protein
MIRHVVGFGLHDPADVDEAVSALRDHLGRIQSVQRLEVGRNATHDPYGGGDGFDVVLYAEFADQDALNAFRRHPAYQDSIAAVRPLRATRVVLDLETRSSDAR